LTDELPFRNILFSAVYHPKESENVEKSVEVFKEYALDVDLPAEEVEAVSQFIKATGEHRLLNSADFVKPENHLNDDLMYFLDFDLEVLSWPEQEYITYARQIRQEFDHVSEADFRAGRSAVLQRLLATDGNVYFTDDFKSREVQARENIGKELFALKM